MNDALIAFAFDKKPQDFNRFLSAPYWRVRYGGEVGSNRFLWTEFFEETANALLKYRTDRTALVAGVHQVASKHGLGYLQDQFSGGGKGPLEDICPFTAMGLFNRTMTNENRSRIASDFASFLGVACAVPASFEAVPLLNNRSSWFFAYAKDRMPGDVDALWRVFAAAHALDEDSPDTRREFVVAFDEAQRVKRVKWNLCTGLYWAHPWDLPTMDQGSRDYLTLKLGVLKEFGGRSEAIAGADYLELADSLKARFLESDFPVHSFPELSYIAWKGRDDDDEGPTSALKLTTKIVDREKGEAVTPGRPFDPYTLNDVVSDGCFLEHSELERALKRLRARKNLILQGAPGTGKTWLAKRLAFALVGRKDDRKIRSVQFHPSLSYEDFVRGWRPTGDGKLSLADGVFMELIQAANKDPNSVFVLVIEEVNRGNPAQIFGELLTLLEAGKRTPTEAIELSYPDANGLRTPVYIPENLYVIGTMNIADRSLALVDLALRRRFAFIDLFPRIDSRWVEWVVSQCNVDHTLARNVQDRMSALNTQIAGDARLGAQFQVGHSYVTPTYRLEDGETGS